MKIDRDELMTLVPHRGKMFLIDRITDADVEQWSISSETEITDSFLFFDSSIGAVPNYVCFEIVAQTVSALTGLYAREHNLPPNMGFILSVSAFHFDFASVRSGHVVKVCAVRDVQVNSVYSFSSRIFIDGTECGGGKLTVMEVVGQ